MTFYPVAGIGSLSLIKRCGVRRRGHAWASRVSAAAAGQGGAASSGAALLPSALPVLCVACVLLDFWCRPSRCWAAVAAAGGLPRSCATARGVTRIAAVRRSSCCLHAAPGGGMGGGSGGVTSSGGGVTVWRRSHLRAWDVVQLLPSKQSGATLPSACRTCCTWQGWMEVQHAGAAADRSGRPGDRRKCAGRRGATPASWLTPVDGRSAGCCGCCCDTAAAAGSGRAEECERREGRQRTAFNTADDMLQPEGRHVAASMTRASVGNRRMQACGIRPAGGSRTGHRRRKGRPDRFPPQRQLACLRPPEHPAALPHNWIAYDAATALH